MDEEDKKMKNLASRFVWAEGQMIRDRPPKERIKKDWLTTHCTHCGYKIQYIPKEGWKGRLRCPECGDTFDVPSENKNESDLIGPTLDDFPKEKWEK